MLFVTHEPRRNEIVVLRFAPTDIDRLADSLTYAMTKERSLAQLPSFIERMRAKALDLLRQIRRGDFAFKSPKIHQKRNWISEFELLCTTYPCAIHENRQLVVCQCRGKAAGGQSAARLCGAEQRSRSGRGRSP